jgi:pimeloyl-ACP methyl ester carboxylesterase
MRFGLSHQSCKRGSVAVQPRKNETMTAKLIPAAALALLIAAQGSPHADSAKRELWTAAISTSSSTTYHTLKVDGIDIFYREAGRKDAPTFLLLHGFPSSSSQFATLIPLLADKYHLVAPDYPGFGLSDSPPPSQYAYTFEHITNTVEKFTEALNLSHFSLYLQDYGGPVGFRLALAHPERVEAIIIQNAIAFDDGLAPVWESRKAFWKDRATYEQKVIPNFLSFEVTKRRHLGSSPNIDRYDPHLWIDEFARLSQPGQYQIQSDLFYDYQTNVASYPAWHEWMRKIQPPMLVMWGKYDPAFTIDGSAAYAYQREVPGAEVHILDAGHFALDEKVDEIAVLIGDFLSKQKLHRS